MELPKILKGKNDVRFSVVNKNISRKGCDVLRKFRIKKLFSCFGYSPIFMGMVLECWGWKII
jgi:hypothetical protein